MSQCAALHIGQHTSDFGVWIESSIFADPGVKSKLGRSGTLVKTEDRMSGAMTERTKQRNCCCRKEEFPASGSVYSGALTCSFGDRRCIFSLPSHATPCKANKKRVSSILISCLSRDSELHADITRPMYPTPKKHGKRPFPETVPFISVHRDASAWMRWFSGQGGKTRNAPLRCLYTQTPAPHTNK